MGGRGASSSLASIRKKALNKPNEFKVIATIDSKILGIKTTSNEVVLTNERKEHIYDDHPEDFDRIIRGLKRTIDNPQEIRQDNKDDDTLYYIRKLKDGNQNVVVKLSTKNDIKHPHNSIISSWIMSEKSLKRFVKKSKNIYNGFFIKK